jgi:FSR family fosmidomycin resistance protein-like MFS transporter
MNAPHARRTLVTACSAHFLHDGMSDLLYVLFPVWARELSLSFAQVGLLRTGYSGAMSLFQIPAGLLAERWGEARLLAAGTAIGALGFFLISSAGSFGVLLLFLLLAGLGSSVQHPLSSSLVSRGYEEGPQRFALGTYNFSGDLGKMTLPACVGFVTTWAGWRMAARGVGGLAILGALAILLILSRLDRSASARRVSREDRPVQNSWGVRDARGFTLLSAIHSLDNGTRTAFLTYLPFLLLAKGAALDTMGLALGLTFTGGAAGKFVCGAVAERLGVIRTVILTEAATSLGVLLLLLLPLRPAFALLVFLGVALNGTSSALYGTVPDLVVPERRSRAYGLFYTVGIGSGAAAPPLFGLLSDRVGVSTMLVVLALLVSVTIPLAHLLRPSLRVLPGEVAGPPKSP